MNKMQIWKGEILQELEQSYIKHGQSLTRTEN